MLSLHSIQIRIRLYILEHANGVRDRQDKRSRRDAHPIPGQPHIIDTLIVSQRLDNLPDPDQIPKALSVYRDAQNASDLAGDTADLRRLLHTSLQGIDDVSMMEVLQVSRDEMPKAIQALQHSLEPNTRRGRPSKASRSKPLPAVPTLADADDETRTLNQDFVRASIQVLRRLSQVADPSAPGRIPARLANGEDDLQEPFASPNAIQTEVPLTPIASTQDGRSDNNPLSATKRRKTGNLKSTKVSLQDPTWKVLPAALMKCKVVDDDWRNYAMLICYGPDRHAERCLSYDERPLHLFQKFKDARKDPVFMLRHIRDLPSPTVVAQQKKDASKVVDTSGAPFPQHRGTVDGKPTQSDSQGSLSNSNLILNEVTPKSAALPITPSSASRGSWYEQEGIRQYGGDEEGTSDEPRTEVSYGIAVCPFVTQEQDEFDVMFGDMFVIVSRKGNWSFVQRDLQGMGAADGDPSKKGWIPTGCLILTRVPIAQAVAPVFSDFSPGSALSLATRCAASAIYARAPILPLRIVSTSFLGHAIIKFKARDDGELDLSKNDPVRVLKRFHHWSYVVKEYSGERGWVPGWYISKVTDRQ
ncbi:hypothetical protein PENSPDRAFT_100073 [Peniophora sp. CONT]|nr:hypothetical protein PENSPDRAFT_100073 [Peniophora sp. CONT]